MFANTVGSTGDGGCSWSQVAEGDIIYVGGSFWEKMSDAYVIPVVPTRKHGWMGYGCEVAVDSTANVSFYKAGTKKWEEAIRKNIYCVVRARITFVCSVGVVFLGTLYALWWLWTWLR